MSLRRILRTRECTSRRRGSAMPSNRGKPTMEIYRPPNVRTDVIQNGLSPLNARLNVHAKEFTMKQGEINTSRSSVNLPATLNSNGNNNNHLYRDSHRATHYLHTSKSSGNILHTLQHSKSSANVLHTLQQSNSSGNILQGPRVHFQLDSSESDKSPVSDIASSQKALPLDFSSKTPLKSCSVSEMKSAFPDSSRIHMVENCEGLNIPSMKPLSRPTSVPSFGLKRSKSLGAADMVAAKGGSGFGVAKEAPDLGSFPLEVQTSIQRAVEDPNNLSARALMDLVRLIMDRVVGSVIYALPAAKLCISIIEKEKKETFLESLLNTCQQWYQERDRVLRGVGSSSIRYCAFVQFLNEMYCELKRRQLQLKTHYEGVPPRLVLLTLLFKCCQDCLKPPNSQAETDTLFFVLTSIGRDLEQELPTKLQQLLSNIRDAFLTANASPAVKKTLLQLIELHASKWQLPASAVMYYTANM
ncbi:CBP80/20-dependent translation initiation factor isoform X2 [Anabrus simplex]|uniref:CBP80/20-dependent translation initiation factor isoform X2 n=1 Tax=Anabrus simplex TaxID=316456 RepID=UPI0035A329B3